MEKGIICRQRLFWGELYKVRNYSLVACCDTACPTTLLDFGQWTCLHYVPLHMVVHTIAVSGRTYRRSFTHTRITFSSDFKNPPKSDPSRDVGHCLCFLLAAKTGSFFFHQAGHASISKSVLCSCYPLLRSSSTCYYLLLSDVVDLSYLSHQVQNIELQQDARARK